MIFLTTIVVLVLDRLTKIWAVNTLSSGKVIDIIKGYFDFSYVENRGAAFGILQGNTILLGIISLVFLAYLLFLFFKSKSPSKLYKVSLGLIISGALGNLYDRFIYKYVVDFIHFHWQETYHFPTFNIADMAVVVGTFLLLAYYFFIEPKENKESKESEGMDKAIKEEIKG